MRRLNNGEFGQKAIQLSLDKIVKDGNAKLKFLSQARLGRNQPSEILSTTAVGAHQTSQEGNYKVGEA